MNNGKNSGIVTTGKKTGLKHKNGDKKNVHDCQHTEFMCFINLNLANSFEIFGHYILTPVT